ncbi:MAG: hypothetical protein L6R35_004296 [Caloplaca aegaea]|nr:MAG: hypothetical protein L6R35_004296 [Caloplaca aegaea]
MDPSQGSPPTTNTSPSTNGSTLTDKNGWDGKLRVSKHAEVEEPDAASDDNNTDKDEDVLPVEKIEPDEDLLDDLEEDTDVRSTQARVIQDMNA